MDLVREKTAILGVIDGYCNSVIYAEKPRLAGEIWANTPDVSLVHPQGHEFGWDQIKENFYKKRMAQLFTKRSLQLVAKPIINIYGHAAVAEFQWEFTATTREGLPQQRSGRESQVLIKLPDLGWRLVHAHHSVPAAPIS